jgi:hypothetical protein
MTTKAGWCPVEVSAGGESIVDELQLDHHGSLSELEGVALRGYRDYFRIRAANSKIVFLGFPDEDACWCAASVLRILPHPIIGDVFPDLPSHRHLRAAQNLLLLAELINAVDIDPDKGKLLEHSPAGRLMILWRQMGHPTRQDDIAWIGGVDRWINLTARDIRRAENAGLELQAELYDRVLETPAVTFGSTSQVAVAEFTEFGRNSLLYDHYTDHKSPMLVAYFADSGATSICVRNMEWARENIGPRGLLHLYELLTPAGAGGREVLGGGSRFHHFTWDDAKELGAQLATLLDDILNGQSNFKPRPRRSRTRK